MNIDFPTDGHQLAPLSKLTVLIAQYLLPCVTRSDKTRHQAYTANILLTSGFFEQFLFIYHFKGRYQTKQKLSCYLDDNLLLCYNNSHKIVTV